MEKPKNDKPKINGMQMKGKADIVPADDIPPLSLQVEKVEVTLEQVKRHIAPNATHSELFMFMGICSSFGLNPLKRQIHFVKYGNNPGQIVVGYEVYLQRAQASGLLDGWDVKLESDAVGEKAVLTIYRKDWDHPFVWEAYRNEFDTGKSTWKAMPTFMLKKVAIGQGFRVCFPEELGGMPYVAEELGQDGQLLTPVPQGPSELSQLRVDYFKEIKGMFPNDKERRDFQEEKTGVRSLAQFGYEEYDSIFAAVYERKSSQAEPEKPEPVAEEAQFEEEPKPEEAEVVEETEEVTLEDLIVETSAVLDVDVAMLGNYVKAVIVAGTDPKAMMTRLETAPKNASSAKALVKALQDWQATQQEDKEPDLLDNNKETNNEH
jgi:phage recombination protein Bet